MKDIYRNMEELLRRGRSVVLATIVHQEGAAPRKVGAKCLFVEDGPLVGTIGGGLLEARALVEAKKVLESGKPRLMRFSLRGVEVTQTDMLCGGDVDVFLEPALSESSAYALMVRRILEILNSGDSGVLATVIDEDWWRGGEVPKLFFSMDELKWSGVGNDSLRQSDLNEWIRQAAASLRSGAMVLDTPKGDVSVFFESIYSQALLYIFGGGHISRQIVPLAARVGFEVVVLDDRPEFADPSRFPEAKLVRILPFNDVVGTLPVGGSSYLVIVTRGHLYDKTVLAQALSTNARYVGMIGSRRKRELIFSKLLEEGFTRDDLARVHSPIGLNIGAETPEEIAVSIVAELIQVRAGAARP
jgi:xanthine dehydrogenase accessory factor